MNIFIVGGGKVASDTFIRYKKEKPCDLLIAADGGLDYLYSQCKVSDDEHFFIPDVMLGDFDTVDERALSFFEEKKVKCHRYPPEKDFTDGELAMTLAIEHHPSTVYMFGLTGSRLDHTLGNIRNLKRFADAGIEAFLIDGNNELTMKKCPADIELTRRDEYKYLSLLAYDGSLHRMRSEGLKYPLSGVSFTPGNAFGVSNEFSKEKAKIEVLDEGYLLIMRSRD